MTFLILAGVIAYVLIVAWVIAVCVAGGRADRAAERYFRSLR